MNYSQNYSLKTTETLLGIETLQILRSEESFDKVSKLLKPF